MNTFETLAARDPKADASHEYTSAKAELSRLHGGRGAAPWESLTAEFRDAGRPYRRAYAEWRAA